MPARRYIVTPQGGGLPVVAPSAYNYKTDVTLLRRQARVFSASNVQAHGRTTILGGSAGGGGGGGSPAAVLLAWMNSLRGSGAIFSAMHWNQFCAPGGQSVGGNGFNQFLNVDNTLQNLTVNDPGNGGDTHLCPAGIAIWLNEGASSTPTQAQCLAAAQALLSTTPRTIVQVNYAPPSPTGGGGEFPGVLDPTNAIYQKFMWGVGGTASAPTAPSVGNQMLLLKQLAPFGPVIFRPLFENNIFPSWWYGTQGAGPSPTQFVALWQQIVNYGTSLGVDFTNHVLLHWCLNANGSAAAANDPGAGYRRVVGADLYGPNTQADVIASLNGSTGSVFPYMNGLGVPVLLGEFGVHSFNNGSVTQFTYDTSIFDSAIQSACSNLVGAFCWTQNYTPSVQLNALRWLQNCVTRGQLPAAV